MKQLQAGKWERGLTLVELLVALVMGLVLLAGVAAVFVANKETFRVQEALARSQENGRFALSTIARDLRSSGHWGCSSVPGRMTPAPVVKVTSPAGSQFIDFTRPVFAFDGGASWSPPLDSHFNTLTADRRPAAGSDVLMTRVLDQNESRVTLHDSRTANITISGATTLRDGDIALISKCDGAAIFELTADPSGNQIPTGGVDLERVFQPPPPTPLPAEVVLSAQVQQIRNRAYYVAPSTADATRMSLWRWDGREDPEELVEGVERLEVRFGIDTTGSGGDGAVDLYLTATQIQARADAPTMWNQVASVVVTLVTSSAEQGVTPVPQSIDINLDGDTTDPGEAPPDSTSKRLRQVFTTTVAVRNRQS